MTKRTGLTVLAFGIALGIASTFTSPAGEPDYLSPSDPYSAPPVAADPWRLVTSPYLWASGIDGDITIRGITADVDLGFDDLFEVTKFAFASHFELRRDKYGFFVSPSFAKFEGDGQGPRVAADFEQDFWLVHGGGFYNIVHTQDTRPLTIDLLAGLRYLNVSTDLDFQGLGPAGTTLSLSSSTELWDPMIGFRAQKYLTERISLAVRGDLGGFGISEGETSDLSWQAMALLGYDINDRFTVYGGYRGIGFDYSDGSGPNERGFDLVMHGILLGVQVRW